MDSHHINQSTTLINSVSHAHTLLDRSKVAQTFEQIQVKSAVLFWYTISLPTSVSDSAHNNSHVTYNFTCQIHLDMEFLPGDKLQN